MASMTKRLRQRLIGAIVLLALAVIFLPMLFTRANQPREVVVEAPSPPAAPSIPEIRPQPVEVPAPEPVPELPAVPETPVSPVPPAADEASAPQGSVPASPQPQAAQPQTSPAQPQASAPAANHLDATQLPLSWSVQLASLSSPARAKELQQKLRSQGYNAYIRAVEGMNRVFVGPVIERAEAERLRDQIQKQNKLNGFVVRFQAGSG